MSRPSTVWTTSKSNGVDDNYYRSTWTRIDALPGQDDGNFDWFSDYDSGEGRMMQAPGQDAADYVVNEESNLKPATFTADDETFDLKSKLTPGMTCLPVAGGEVATSFAHAHRLASEAGAAHLLRALPEVKLAYRLRDMAEARRAH